MSSQKSNLVGLTTTAAQVLIAASTPKTAILRDSKTANTGGGSISINTWTTRALNAEDDPDGIVSLSSNQFTLQPGHYVIEWTSMHTGTNGHRTRLYNVTGSAEVALSTSGYQNRTTADDGSMNTGVTVVTIAVATTYKIEAIVGFNGSIGNELGQATNLDSKAEYYTQVKITKYA